MEACIQCAERAGWCNFKASFHDLWKATEIKDPQCLEAKTPTHSYSFRKSHNINMEKITEPFSYIQGFPVFQLAHTAFCPFTRHHQRRVWPCCLYCPLSCLYTLTRAPLPFLPQPKQSQLSSSPGYFSLQSYYALASCWIPSSTSMPSFSGAQHWTCHSDVSHWLRVEVQHHLPPPCCQHPAWCSPASSEFLSQLLHHLWVHPIRLCMVHFFKHFLPWDFSSKG